jgi:DNA repair protein SbcC/Rad50
MLKKIEIKNFQSHEDTTLELHPGVNVIVGPSDAGKSAIIRALRWLTFNRPSGGAMCSHWGGVTDVSAWVGKKCASHLRGPNGNKYVLIPTGGGKGEIQATAFNAIGTEVPAEIAEFLNLEEINFQGQVDPHFLFSNTPGEVAAHLNQITGLQVIDVGTKNLKSASIEIDRELKQKKQLVLDLTKELEAYETLPLIEKKVQAIEKLDARRTETAQDERKLQGLTSRLDEAKSAASDLSWSLGAKERLEEVELSNRTLQKVTKTVTRLDDLVGTLKQAQVVIDECPDTDKAGKLHQQLEKLNGNGCAGEGRIKQLNNLLHNLEIAIDTGGRAAEEQTKLEDQFHQLMPSTCPLCGSKI